MTFNKLVALSEIFSELSQASLISGCPYKRNDWPVFSFLLSPCNEDCLQSCGQGKLVDDWPTMFFLGKGVLVIGFSSETTLAVSSICSYRETFGAGAVIGSHGIVAGMGAGIPSCAFIFI